MPARRPKGGRPASRRAAISLRVEGLAVARDDGADHRVLRREGLDQCPARAAGASRASGHLRQELERPLRRAHVAEGEAEVAVDDADQRQERKIVALGDELGADDDVDLAFLDRRQFLAQTLHPADDVARHQDRARVREARGHLLAEPLDAWPDRDQALRVAAVRAVVRTASRSGRNGGRGARRGSGARPARSSSWGTGNDGRRSGRA